MYARSSAIQDGNSQAVAMVLQNKFLSTCRRVPIAYRVAVVVLVLVLLICFASKSSVALQKRTYSKPFVRHIQSLAQQAYQWHRTSTQDQDAVLALVHNCYAQGLVKSLRQVADEADFKRITGLDLTDFENDLETMHGQLVGAVVVRS